MGISKIQKLELIGLVQEKDAILSLLQKSGMVQLISVRQEVAPAAISTFGTESKLLAIEEALSVLASFRKEETPFGGMFPLKPLVFKEELEEVLASFDYQSLLNKITQLRNHLKDIQNNKEKLVQELRLLEPWRRLDVSLDELHPSRACGQTQGVLLGRDYAGFLEEIEKERIHIYHEVVRRDKTNTYIILVYLKEEFEKLEHILKGRRFNFVVLPKHKVTVKERLYEINSEILILDDQIKDTKMTLTELAKEQFRLMVIYDYLAMAHKRIEADKNLAHQRYTFVLNGWIRAADANLLQKELAKNFTNIELFISQPQGEEAPVALENKRIMQPFEFITKIYGYPLYNELDPTPFLAPFFFLYVGFCVSDVGYGILMIVLCWSILKKFRMGPQGRRFFTLFLYCGISTIFAGALTGSWFGNILDIAAENFVWMAPLKKFKDSLILLDPLKEPTKLLAIALGLGIFQIWFGNIVAVIQNIKNKRYLDILYDQATTLALLFGLTGLGFIFLRIIGDGHAVLFRNSALLGGLGIVFTQGRAEKNIGSKIFYGIFALYNGLSGYLSDILSYSRLWALGLVTGVMASTINLISIQFSQIFVSLIPGVSKVAFLKFIIGTIILIIIFIFGHTISFFMNLLGAFVHPLRLQFVEFFSKFFKPGGVIFKPFKEEPKYINFG